MLLDSLKLRSVNFQLRYDNAYELWDSAGAIARSFSDQWQGLRLEEGQPNRVTLQKSGLAIRTEVDNAVISLDTPEMVEARVRAITGAYAVWQENLRLDVLNRVSMRVEYVKDFPTPRAAAAQARELGLVQWPEQRVFGQSEVGQKNGMDCLLRFEDEFIFTTVRVRTESILMQYELHPDFGVAEPKVSKERHRVVVDFDRGTAQSIKSKDFVVEEWVKGYFHVLRRDIGKVIPAGAL